MAKSSNGKKKNVWGKLLTTPPSRLVFPAIGIAIPFREGQEARFKAQLVCNPGEKLTALIAQIEEVGLKAFGEKWATDSKYQRPYSTGEQTIANWQEAHADKEPSENFVKLYTGRFRLTTSCSGDRDAPECRLADRSLMPRRPGNGDDLKNIEQVFYGGAFVRCAVTAFSYVEGKNRGVALLLKGIQFIQEGARLGVENLENVFAEEAGEIGEWDDEVSSALGDDDGEEAAALAEMNV